MYIIIIWTKMNPKPSFFMFGCRIIYFNYLLLSIEFIQKALKNLNANKISFISKKLQL